MKKLLLSLILGLFAAFATPAQVTIHGPVAIGNVGLGGGGSISHYFNCQSNCSGGFGFAASTTNAQAININIPVALTGIGHFAFNVTTADTTGGNHYSIGLYNSSGVAVCTTTAVAYITTGNILTVCTQGTNISIPVGEYTLELAGSATVLNVGILNTGSCSFSASNYSVTTGGQVPSSITPPTITASTINTNGCYQPAIGLVP